MGKFEALSSLCLFCKTFFKRQNVIAWGNLYSRFLSGAVKYLAVINMMNIFSQLIISVPSHGLSTLIKSGD